MEYYSNLLSNIFNIIILNIEYLTYITIFLVSFLIYKKSINFYKLSSYQSFKHFANGFLFLGLSSIINLIQLKLNSFITKSVLISGAPILKIYESLTFLNYYFLAMCGLYLIYSLVWKEIKNKKFNIISLNLVAITLSYISYTKPFIFFIVMIILLVYGIMISYEKYTSSKNKHSQLFLISLILITTNFIIQLLLGFFKIIKFYSHITTIGVFLILLYLTQKK